ncbi:MAG: hypothetical protein NC427_06075 [Ruminococcus flavefaciens]|nr:hypothetical protein [Ruminococcus flavefaciens]
MQIERLIKSIQKRPKMFLKEEKIEYIYYLLSGYCGANRVSEDNMDCMFCTWFRKWLIMWIVENVDEKYSVKTAYWYDDIKAIAQGKQEEIKMFFELCDLFFEDYKNKVGYFSWK